MELKLKDRMLKSHFRNQKRELDLFRENLDIERRRGRVMNSVLKYFSSEPGDSNDLGTQRQEIVCSHRSPGNFINKHSDANIFQN